jgi:hypothetical protein
MKSCRWQAKPIIDLGLRSNSMINPNKRPRDRRCTIQSYLSQSERSADIAITIPASVDSFCASVFLVFADWRLPGSEMEIETCSVP